MDKKRKKFNVPINKLFPTFLSRLEENINIDIDIIIKIVNYKILQHLNSAFVLVIESL